MEGAAPGDATRFPVEKEVVKGPGPSGAGPAAGPGLGSLFGGWLTGAYGTASSSGAKKKDASTTGKAASNAWSSVGEFPELNPLSVSFDADELSRISVLSTLCTSGDSML